MILKPISTLNGPASFHVLKKVESSRPFNSIALTIDSYADESTYQRGGNLIIRHTLLMPPAELGVPQEASAEGWLIKDQASPLSGGQVVSDDMQPLDVAQSNKFAELNAACQSSCYSGFDSDALGEVHRYGSDAQDQANLVASVVDSKLDNPDGWVTAFKCAGPDGIRNYKMHTAAQIQKVGKDGKAAITGCLLMNEILIAQVRAAMTVEEIAAIHWPK